MALPLNRGRPRTSKLTRAEQLRNAKRTQRARAKQAGIAAVQIALEAGQAERFRAAAASPRFRTELARLIDAMAVDRTAWPVLKELTWNRADRWIPADEALALYERNWRHVDTERIGKDEARMIARLTERFGGGSFNG